MMSWENNSTKPMEEVDNKGSDGPRDRCRWVIPRILLTDGCESACLFKGMKVVFEERVP